MNKRFLFATYSQKIRSHVVESQITLLVKPCLNQLQKTSHSLSHGPFNDSISKFYQCSIWEFCRGKSMFFSICLGKKKNAEVIKFLGILKKVCLREWNIFLLKKEKQCFTQKSYFCLSSNFQTWFHNADHLLYYRQLPVFSFHTFLFSYISL